MKDLSKWMREDMNKIKNLSKTEVIITYDCSDAHAPFAELLLKMLQEEYCCEFITESTYKFPGNFSDNEIESIKTRIKEMFRDSQKNIDESQKEKQTLVKLIKPIDGRFSIETVIEKHE